MRISDIIKNRRGTSGPWRIKTTDEGRELWHYSTRMLLWTDTINGPILLDHSTGWGSASDQNGVNTAFRVLNLPFYYKRAGGATIVNTTTGDPA